MFGYQLLTTNSFLVFESSIECFILQTIKDEATRLIPLIAGTLGRDTLLH